MKARSFFASAGAGARLLLALAAASLLGACAHPIVITPDFNAVQTADKPVTPRKAGYYIAAEDRAREVTTPGGGGDKIRYFPYRDLEAGLYKVLSSTFASVTKLDAPANAAVFKGQGLHFVVTPKITTASNSESMFTWPPTSFTVELECRLVADGGAEVAVARVTGFGNATFDEFKSDFALAAKRASLDALNKLSVELQKMPALRN